MAVLLSWQRPDPGLRLGRRLSSLQQEQIRSIPALLTVRARGRPTVETPRGRERGWHVVLLDDEDHREEHTQQILVAMRVAEDASAARLMRGGQIA